MPQPNHISVLGVPDPATLDDDLKLIWAKCVEKLGFVPNVFSTYSKKPQRLRHFMTMSQRDLVDDGDRDGLRGHGLSDDDIFDLSETTAFFNLSNRMASATDMMPNAAYHRSDRGPGFVAPVGKPKAKKAI